MQVVAGVHFQWSRDNWVHNVFRFYELIFWRRDEIRRDFSAWTENGQVRYKGHSLEGKMWLIEAHLRRLARSLQVVRVKIYIPMLELPHGIRIPASPYLFAVAFDAAATIAYSTPFSMTVGGTANVLIVGIENGNTQGDTVTASAWNGQSMSLLVKVSNTGGSAYTTYLYGVQPSSSGTHDISITGGAAYGGLAATSYSGASVPSNTASHQVSGSTTSISQSITVGDSNSWVVGYGCQNSNTPNSWTGLTARCGDTARDLGDSNATVSAGSHSYTWGGATSSNWALLLAELPTGSGSGFGSTVKPTANLLLLGAG